LSRAVEHLEDVVCTVIDRFRVTQAKVNGRYWLKHKKQLRGYSCHCPPTQRIHLVHSEGLRECADVVVDFGSNVGSPVRRQVPVAALRKIAPEIGNADIVHIKTDCLPLFLSEVLPHTGGPVVLVTGDSDYAPINDHLHLLDHPKIIHWFVQNCDWPGRHAKLTRIPIGVDNPKYTKLDKRLGFMLATLGGRNRLELSFTRNDMGDQLCLQQVRDELKTAFAQKETRAMCTFHFNQKFIPNFREIPDRLLAYELLKDSPSCAFEKRRIPQVECWQMHDRFAFELSPHGKGLDCFRTWEALALGCVPIVKASSLDPLYEDEAFPVVIVQSFSEVTPENLKRWQHAHADAFGPDLLMKLSNGYWVERIKKTARVWRRDHGQQGAEAL
jgi:hypothetical protein